VLAPRLRGTRIDFATFDADGSARHYRGRVEGGRMSGDSIVPGDVHGVRPLPWSATRN
jgi:hypothetical protein